MIFFLAAAEENSIVMDKIADLARGAKFSGARYSPPEKKKEKEYRERRKENIITGSPQKLLG